MFTRFKRQPTTTPAPAGRMVLDLDPGTAAAVEHARDHRDDGARIRLRLDDDTAAAIETLVAVAEAAGVDRGTALRVVNARVALDRATAHVGALATAVNPIPTATPAAMHPADVAAVADLAGVAPAVARAVLAHKSLTADSEVRDGRHG